MSLKSEKNIKTNLMNFEENLQNYLKHFNKSSENLKIFLNSKKFVKLLTKY